MDTQTGSTGVTTLGSNAIGPQREELMERLKGLLTIHNASEENLVYPAIRELAKRPMHAGQLYHQQDEAKVVVWELDMMGPADPEFSDKATKLREAVLAHVRQEEESEFPHLREALDPEQMEELTDSLREFRSSFTFSPKKP